MTLPISMYAQLPILLVVVGLVYSATRHDEWSEIFAETARWVSRMMLFMLGVAAVMFALAWLCG